MIKKYFIHHRNFFLIAAIVGILMDIFVFRFTSDVVIMGLTAIWIGAVIGWRLEGRFSIFGALIFLMMCPFLLMAKQEAIAEKAAIWTYMFLVVGVIQQLIEIHRNMLAGASDTNRNMPRKRDDIRPVGDIEGGWRDFDEFIKKLADSADGIRARIMLMGAENADDADSIHADGADRRLITLTGWVIKGLVRYMLVGISLLTQKAVVVLIVKREQWARDLVTMRERRSWWWRGMAAIGKVILTLALVAAKYFWEITGGILGILGILGISREIQFYRRFFENKFWLEFGGRLLPYLLGFWLILIFLAIIFWLKKRATWRWRKIILVGLLLLFWRGNQRIFRYARAKFEFQPYILRIDPDIASRYMAVKIYGRNFRNLPFTSEVFLAGRPQRIKAWSDKLIVVEIDPLLSKTGWIWVQVKDGAGRKKASNRVWFTYYDSQKATPQERQRFWQMLEKQALKEARNKY